MKLNYKRTILVGFAFFLISAFWQAYDAIVPLILTNHFGLDQLISGIVMSIDNVLAVFMLPIFGALSDKIMTRFGKRTPFIFIGTIAAVLAFISLTLIDSYQLRSVLDAGIAEKYQAATELLQEANAALKEAGKAGDTTAVALAKESIDHINKVVIAGIREETLEITLGNLWPIIGFIGVLLLTLISMATFRSPAVALMPDVTIKPLRSKGNAIINLMGTAGGILVLVLGMVFKTSGNKYMQYTGYVLAVCAIMIAGLAVFIATVKERKWAEEMEEQTKALGLEEVVEVHEDKRSLSRAELKSLFLILASVALWYVGYNSITSKYSVYATNILFFDFNLTLIIAQAAAIVAYIPVGIVASKIGRRKTILAGITMLASAFFIANFITFSTPEFAMYPVFILAGIGWATINVNSFPMVVELAKGGEVGKYTGYYYTASMAAQIVAPILSGAIYKLVGYMVGGDDIEGMRYVFFAFGTVFVALSFVTMFFVKHGDAKPEAQGALESLAGADD